jgi:hypothetical protein
VRTDERIEFDATQPAELESSAPSITEPPSFLADAVLVVRLRSRLHELSRIDRTGTLFAPEREAIESALFEMRDVHWTRDAFISFIHGVEGTSRSVWLLLAVSLAIAAAKAVGALNR